MSPSAALSDKDKTIHDDGLVTILKKIHDDLDDAVLDAYGWGDLVSEIPLANRLARGDEELKRQILQRLVDLNHKRSVEEANGRIRYLRPEYQDPHFGKEKVPLEKQGELVPQAKVRTGKKAAKLAWPADLPSQVVAIQMLLPQLGPDVAAISVAFGRKSKKREQQVAGILETLESLGQI